MWFKAVRGVRHFSLTFRGLPDQVIPCGWSVSFTPVVNAEDADEIGWFEAEKDTPLADAQAQFTGTVFEGLHIAVACRCEAYQRRI
jgi:hypothetical protein